MKWKTFPLATDYTRAKNQVFENLSMGAYEHTLTKKLIARFAAATGPAIAIAFDSLELSQLTDFTYSTYGSSNRAELQNKPASNYPVDGLILFVDDFLRGARESVVLCENWAWKREHLTPPRACKKSCVS